MSHRELDDMLGKGWRKPHFIQSRLTSRQGLEGSNDSASRSMAEGSLLKQTCRATESSLFKSFC